MESRISWWCEQGRCFSCQYERCVHGCHAGQLGPIGCERRRFAADQAAADLERYWADSGYAHAATIAKVAR